MSLTVPITNSLAFLFTVLGEWWADGKVISRGKLHTYLPSHTFHTFHTCIRWTGGGGSQLQDFRSVTRCICYDERGASCNGGRRLADFLDSQIRGLEWGLYSAGLPCAFIVKPHRIEKGFIMVSWEIKTHSYCPLFSFISAWLVYSLFAR